VRRSAPRACRSNRNELATAAGLDDQHHGRTVRTTRPDISSAISRRPLALATSKGNEPATRPGWMTSTAAAGKW